MSKPFSGYIYCKTCRKMKRPRKRLVNYLILEVVDTIAALCPKCGGVLFVKYPDGFEPPRPGARITVRSINMTLNQFTEKYSPWKTKRRWGTEIMYEPEAENYLGLRRGALKSMRKRGMAPSYQYSGGFLYLRDDLDEHIKKRRAF